jgi:antitoxin MazE
MELPIINIGDARGIRLSETILEKYSIGDKIELVLEEDYIVLKPKIEPRKGWDAAFREMHENGDDKLLIDDVFADENFEEWSK